MFLRAYPEFHAERIENIVNGVKESEDLLEPSIGLSLRGMILSPQFMTYEVGATAFYSRLTGSEVTLRDQELNYYLLTSLFPGRKFSMNFLARRYTDQLRDNLLLFNRNRFTEVGGELLLQEGERRPFLGLRYFRRNRVTSNEQTVALFPPCDDPDPDACEDLLFAPTTSRKFVEFSENSSEADLFLDKRNRDLQYHLGFLRTTYDSKDFGYSTTSSVVNFDVTRWMMSRRLQVNLRGDIFRTRTENQGTTSLADETAIDGGGLGFLGSREITNTETSLALGLEYRGTRYDHNAGYSWDRSTTEGFTTTQQEGDVGTTYRISPKTTLRADYATVLVDGPATGSRHQNLTLRLTRTMTPNLVFYVEGEAETDRRKNSSQPILSNLAFRNSPKDLTLADIEAGVDYARRVGRFNTYSSLVLGAGRATLSPGGSGLTTNVEARFGVVGTAFQRINLAGHLYYQNNTDGSGYAPDLKQTTGQLLATRIVGRRLQLRARALAVNTSLDRTKQLANLGRSFDTPVLLDERLRSAEIGFVAFLPRATYASLAVGRQSTVNNVGRGDIENRFNYVNASLTLHPVRHLEVVGSARIQRGFELNDIQDDRDFIEIDAIYRLRDWSFELGYTTNQYILATTDYEQKRVYFTVRREFGWRLR